MNWYKSARRNPYEQLANKFANQFFQWFIQQPYAEHYDGNKEEEKENIGFINLPLEKEDFDVLEISDLYSKGPYITMEIIKMHQKHEPFIISASAYGDILLYPSDDAMDLPIISVVVHMNKMNQNLWQSFKQKLHMVLRHEFEHTQQSIKAFKTKGQSRIVSQPKDQKLNEFNNMKTQLTNIQRKLKHIKNISIHNAHKQMKLYCDTNPNQKLCHKAKQDFQYALEIENVTEITTKHMEYFANPIELEAFATGAYYDAGKRGISAEDAINDLLQHALVNPNFPHPQVDWLLYEAKNIIIHWMLRFVENRYPDYSKQRNQQLA